MDASLSVVSGKWPDRMLRRTTVTVSRCVAPLSLLLGCAITACGSGTSRQPPGRPPTPQSISRKEPGGDAHDPHRAALQRLLQQPWRRRLDKDRQVKVPVPDYAHWKRVRFRGIDHFVGFRYGKRHHVVTAAFVVDVQDAARNDSERCMRRFETWGRPQARSWNVRLEPIERTTTDWKGQQVVVHRVDGHVDTLLSRRRFSAAWAAYPAYPDACLVYGVAAQWFDQPELARRVRDRFVQEGFSTLLTLTDAKPHRHQ
jgi:hypothetical protein